MGISGGRSSRRSSVRRSGSLAGATIEVWKAWLTGSIAVWKPRCSHRSTAASTAAVAPPMTACDEELTLAITT